MKGKIMTIHHQKEIVQATKELSGRGKKSEIFSRVYHNTNGGARKNKLEKAWKYLRGQNIITSDKSCKKYWVEESNLAA